MARISTVVNLRRAGIVACPSRKTNTRSGPNDGVSCLDEDLGELTVLEILLCAQAREIEVRHFDPPDLAAGDRSAFCIGIGECVADANAAWIRMALHNRYPAQPGSFFYTETFKVEQHRRAGSV